jgi:hypothetical protein
LVQVFDADITIVHALDQVAANGRGKPGPGFNLGHCLFAKNEAAEGIPKLLHLIGVTGHAKAIGQLKKLFLFLLLGFDSPLDEFHEDTVIAEIALPGYRFNLFRDFSG